ncbi:hypothetical protein BURC_03953 [Burkholderiaceae bacterium]|nr:hypothetical protein BURC_03953 [Burkholderiaceae bacterium]
MKTSALKKLTAIAIVTTASVSFAQQTNDPNSPANTGESAGSVEADMNTNSTRTDLSRNCIGLSDRQTEAACKQGYPVDQADAPLASGPELAGRTEDQAN